MRSVNSTGFLIHHHSFELLRSTSVSGVPGVRHISSAVARGIQGPASTGQGDTGDARDRVGLGVMQTEPWFKFINHAESTVNHCESYCKPYDQPWRNQIHNSLFHFCLGQCYRAAEVDSPNLFATTRRDRESKISTNAVSLEYLPTGRSLGIVHCFGSAILIMVVFFIGHPQSPTYGLSWFSPRKLPLDNPTNSATKPGVLFPSQWIHELENMIPSGTQTWQPKSPHL